MKIIESLNTLACNAHELAYSAEGAKKALTNGIRKLTDLDDKPINWGGPAVSVVTFKEMDKAKRMDASYFIYRNSYEKMIQAVTRGDALSLKGVIRRILDNSLMASDLDPNTRLQGCILHPEAIVKFKAMIDGEEE